ncbi:hypothetical protein DTO217A2_3866 [Paecilomyces variotii]|nr:hypothetical protein DTO217A2_3866 [Paecilomyces variotii]KAJ9384825.1 hypothetical protein DTO063F5_4523 [Paecilomyces variotii]
MMSGNYDFPPASTRPRRSSPEHQEDRPNSVTARLQHLRELLSSERLRERGGYTTARALDTLNQEIEDLRSDRVRDRTNYEQARAAVDRQLQHLRSDLTSSRGDRIRRRVSDRDRQGLTSPPTSTPPLMEQEPNPAASQPSPSRPRRRALRPSEALARIRERDGRARGGSMDTSALQAFQQGARMRESDSPLSSLLDEPTPPMASPSLLADYTPDRASSRWTAKRRKLDSDDKREGLRGFSYGQYGQVVPGPLQMEIVSCDGGTYAEPDGETSWPENVLLNDSSVYCTKSDRCNLILRHRGETPFCLRKIVIKAPKSGFDAPIQEGMIFVSMSSDDLLARTARYQIQYSPSRRRARRHRRVGMRPSEEYANAFRSPLRSLERALIRHPGYPDSEFDFAGQLTSTTRASVDRDSTSEFRVTTEFDERSDDGDDDQENDDDFPSAAEMERMQMVQIEDDVLCSEDEDSESDEDANEMSAFNRGRLDMRRRMRAARRQDILGDHDVLRRRRMAPSLIEPVIPSSTDNYYPDGSSEVMKPHAQFFIEREKSMVSIKFDPPPSGRFILIKLWSPYSGGNIDIQSIVAYGYAGPRFFPAGDFR